MRDFVVVQGTKFFRLVRHRVVETKRHGSVRSWTKELRSRGQRKARSNQGEEWGRGAANGVSRRSRLWTESDSAGRKSGGQEWRGGTLCGNSYQRCGISSNIRKKTAVIWRAYRFAESAGAESEPGNGKQNGARRRMQYRG